MAIYNRHGYVVCSKHTWKVKEYRQKYNLFSEGLGLHDEVFNRRIITQKFIARQGEWNLRGQRMLSDEIDLWCISTKLCWQEKREMQNNITCWFKTERSFSEFKSDVSDKFQWRLVLPEVGSNRDNIPRLHYAWPAKSVMNNRLTAIIYTLLIENVCNLYKYSSMLITV